MDVFVPIKIIQLWMNDKLQGKIKVQYGKWEIDNKNKKAKLRKSFNH